jgi:hypothetical protein
MTPDRSSGETIRLFEPPDELRVFFENPSLATRAIEIVLICFDQYFRGASADSSLRNRWTEASRKRNDQVSWLPMTFFHLE